ncbi:multicopper oxidase domain-containing protein [Jatrophihabitans telluris]|uniref:Multicopper oxidase domain-containing protein n=1 Tax=Jatrophihabitans telluris TaxID=2038343 RepID=A0ABY4QZ90_9ACTN|nr:multicopper oxidase domain-containing protein [Jatrophihabitans telluris]UQX88810.1 multicopper oxidase domain-containing protein [Jatrophihabitans telluris]
MRREVRPLGPGRTERLDTNEENIVESQGIRRRTFLQAAGVGALAAAAGAGTARAIERSLFTPAGAATTSLSLAATDGYITMPGRDDHPVYVFGFIKVDPALSPSDLISTFKGHAQHTAPTLDFRQGDDIKITLTNLGLLQRPDLVDSHTIHWHGFDLPSPLNDGVPEVSVAVPISKQLTYFYRPHREGTYMYHCHFEDVEHVQMGMTGVVFVRPLQDGTPKTFGSKTFTRFAYNDGDGSTGYDRHFAILLNEIETRQHDADRDIQEFIPTDFNPAYFTMNGRCYPQTTLLNDDAFTSSGLTTPNATAGTVDVSQPNSSLMQVNPGERVLLRLANLGYQQHSLELPGIPLHVVGQDASLLRNGSGASAVDTSYWTNHLYLGPGEARDVLFDVPAYSASRPSGSDSRGAYNVYYLKSRDWRQLANLGATGPGGMMTEVRAYTAPVPAQSIVGQTYA